MRVERRWVWNWREFSFKRAVAVVQGRRPSIKTIAVADSHGSDHAAGQVWILFSFFLVFTD